MGMVSVSTLKARLYDLKNVNDGIEKICNSYKLSNEKTQLLKDMGFMNENEFSTFISNASYLNNMMSKAYEEAIDNAQSPGVILT